MAEAVDTECSEHRKLEISKVMSFLSQVINQIIRRIYEYEMEYNMYHPLNLLESLVTSKIITV